MPEIKKTVSHSQVETYHALTQKIAQYVQPISYNKYVKARIRLSVMLSKGQLAGGQTSFISAFSWMDTPEGYKFWSEINDICAGFVPVVGDQKSEDVREII